MCHSLRVKAIYLLVLLLFLCGTPVSFGQLTFGIGSISPSEEQGVVTCTIHIQPSATPVTVDYRTLSDTATAGVDFIPVSGTLTFQPGQTTKDFDVTILSDSLVEGREYFTVDLFNPSTGYLPFSASSIPIPDSERGYFIAASDTPENADFVEIVVIRFGEFDFESTVEIHGEPDIVTIGDTHIARPGIDFVDETLILHFPPGDNVRQTAHLKLINNPIEDGDRKLLIVGANPVPALPFDQPSASIQIIDNELGYFVENVERGYPLDIDSYEGSAPYITLRRIGDYPAADVDATFSEQTYRSISIRARAGVDFTAGTTTVHFDAGQTSARVPLPIINDAEPERTEYFQANFTKAGDPQSLLTSYSIPIRDNEFNPLVATGFCPPTGPDDFIASIVPAGSDKVWLLINTYPDSAKIIRVNLAGEPDTTFAPISFDPPAWRLVPLSDGRFLVFEMLPDGHRLRRLNPDLTADASFTAYLEHDIDTVAETLNGKIFVSSTGPNRPSLLVRLNADGSLDSSFHAPIFSDDEVSYLVADPAGGVYISGFGKLDGEDWPETARLNSDGSLDRAFKLTEDAIPTAFINGRLYGRVYQNQRILKRFNADGSVDSTFPEVLLGDSFAVLPDQNGFFILVTDGPSSVVEHYKSDGSRDPSFIRGTFDAIAYTATLVGRNLIVRFDNGQPARYRTINGVRVCNSMATLKLGPVERILVEPSHNIFREDSGATTLDVIRTGNNQNATGTIRYESRDGSATGGQDFNAAMSGEISFAAGESRATIPLHLIDDESVEFEEVFNIDFLNTDGSILSASEVSIISDEVGLKILGRNGDYIELESVNILTPNVWLYGTSDFKTWMYYGTFASNTRFTFPILSNSQFFRCRASQ